MATLSVTVAIPSCGRWLVSEVNCPQYEKGCICQLCPMENDIDKHLWYPDESVCSSRQYARLPWLKTQRKVAKLHLGPDTGFFTVRMLEVIGRVSKGLQGVDPDSPGSEQRWLAARVSKRMTGERQYAVTAAGCVPSAASEIPRIAQIPEKSLGSYSR